MAFNGLIDVMKDFYYETYVYTSLEAPKVDLKGQVIIVTGASAGLGKESVRQLAFMGPSKIIMTARNLRKGQAVRDEIARTTNCNIVLKSLDLCSFKSVNAFCKEILQEEKKIDVLMCNAGVGETTTVAKRTEDGFDEMYASPRHKRLMTGSKETI